MPQLDKLTYFSQFFWLCLLLFTFYILFINNNNGILGISRILKLRNQLLSHRGNKIRSKDPKNLEDISRKGFSTGLSYMYSSLSEVSQWCQTVDYLRKSRQITLISDFGEISGSRGMERQILHLISKSSYNTSSSRITCGKNVMLTHAPYGQGGVAAPESQPDPDLKANTLRYDFVKRRNYSTSGKPLLTLRDIITQWREITGKPSTEFVLGLKRLSRTQVSRTAARVTYGDIKSFSLTHIAGMRRRGEIPNIFDSVTSEEKRQIYRFLASEGTYSDVLDAFFDPADPQLDPHVHQEPQPEPPRDQPARPFDLNANLLEEPEPPRDQPARTLDQNKKLPLPFDLNANLLEEPEPPRDQPARTLDQNKKLPLPFDLNDDVGDDGGGE